ncbi:hypothetical protein, partial [Lactobacillus gallinarum]|uniref:hypothetical protein n=1 Tax=Lactobacillus gallinarum TaxID=52242 RepID=UPI0024B99150
GHKQNTLISKEWYQRILCSEAYASFFYQKIPLIEYHRNLSTGFIIEPKKSAFVLCKSRFF